MSSSLTAQIIIKISQQFLAYSQISLIFIALIGNLCNILVFSYVKSFRLNQCAFYLTVESIADLLFLVVVLPSGVSKYLSGYDPQQSSLVWCKLRQTIVMIFSLMSFSSICFAAIDQYLSTHYNPRLRQLSTLKLAHRLVYSFMVIWILYGIPSLIFYEIESPSGCGIYNVGFSRYYSFVVFCALSGILPNIISAFFAALAYLNVRRIIRRQMPIARRRLDRQLTVMVLTRVAFLVITTLPYVIDRIYTMNRSIDPNDSVRAAIEQLITAVTTILFDVNSAVSNTIVFCLYVFNTF
jgi:hypothetical protein